MSLSIFQISAAVFDRGEFNPQRTFLFGANIGQGFNLTLLPANLYNLPFASGDPKAFAQGFKREAGVFRLSRCENKAGAAPATVCECKRVATRHCALHGKALLLGVFPLVSPETGLLRCDDIAEGDVRAFRCYT